MTPARKAEALARLTDHAATNGVAAPTVLLACDEGPSSEVLDYCATHGLTLDWVYRGGQPKHRPELTDISA